MSRAIALAIVLGFAAAAGLGVAWLARGKAAIATRADVEPAVLVEVRAARAAGLRPIEGGTVRSTVVRSIPVAAGECIAIVAGAWGREELRHVELSLGRDASLTTRAPTEVEHLAACATLDETAVIRVELTSAHDGWDGAPGELSYAILRGHVADLRGYRRLSLGPEAAVLLTQANVRERETHAVRDGTRLGEAHVVHVGTAVLLPSSRATHAGARALLGAPGLVPALADADADPFATPADQTVPARAHTASGLARLLAVVDAGALGAPCVAVSLARLDEPESPARVRRIELPSLTETVVSSLDRAIAIDRVCPARGLFLYVTDDEVAADVSVSTYATTADADARAEPSTFEATALDPPELAAARASCAADEPSGCMRLAGYAAAGVPGAGEPQPPLEHACDGGNAEACDRLASLLSGDGADAAERRACVGGWPPACQRRAARFLEGARDLRAAYATYRFDCSLGDATGCTAMQTMTEWQLASETPVPAAADVP